MLIIIVVFIEERINKLEKEFENVNDLLVVVR